MSSLSNQSTKSSKRKADPSEDLQIQKTKKTKQKPIAIGDIVQKRVKLYPGQNREYRWAIEEGPVISFSMDNTVLTFEVKKITYEDDGTVEYLSEVIFSQTQCLINSDGLSNCLKVVKRVDKEKQHLKPIIPISIGDTVRVRVRLAECGRWVFEEGHVLSVDNARITFEVKKRTYDDGIVEDVNDETLTIKRDYCHGFYVVKSNQIKQHLKEIRDKKNIILSADVLYDSYCNGLLRVYGDRNRVLVRKYSNQDKYEVILPKIPLLPFHRYWDVADDVVLFELTREVIKMYPRLGDKEWYEGITKTNGTTSNLTENIQIGEDGEDNDIIDCILVQMRDNLGLTMPLNVSMKELPLQKLKMMSHIRARYMYEHGKEFSSSNMNECYKYYI